MVSPACRLLEGQGRDKGREGMGERESSEWQSLPTTISDLRCL